jgi:tartrate dehydrogenase/decarboxylase/D-malate dehydrogenase
MLLPIRQGFDQYINLRPVRLLEGVASPLAGKAPKDIDIVCVRENCEGEYCGVGGRVYPGTPQESAVQSAVFTYHGTERVLRYAFEYARRHGRKKVTSATKSNAINYSMVFWDDVFRDVSARYPDVRHEPQLIDSLCARFVTAPESLDVVVASNLFGDILTDLGAAIAGSMGLAPSANLNPEGCYPSLFQAIHGSAPGLAGKGIANPIATIWSVSMMLDHLGEAELGSALLKAIESVLAEGTIRTPDLGGKSTTRQVGRAIIGALQKPRKASP